MTGQLITLPVRIYARGARLLLHAAEDVTGKAVMGTLRVAGALGNLRPGSGASNQTRPTPARPASQPDPRSAATRSRPERANGAGTASPTRRQPRGEPAPGRTRGNGAPPPLASERLEQEGRTASIDLDAPAPAAPDHVSQDPVLVREESEAGAQEGVGATVSVQEPWEGYRKMAARDIIARLSAFSTAELGAVALYESSHRKRQTVLAAVERELTRSQG